MSFIMSFITVNCDLLSFTNHSNIMNKAEGTALLRTKTEFNFIYLFSKSVISEQVFRICVLIDIRSAGNKYTLVSPVTEFFTQPRDCKMLILNFQRTM